MPAALPHSLKRRTLIVAALALGAAGCSIAAGIEGSGQRASEAREVAAFDAIDLAGPIRLVVRQAERQALRVEADDNLLPLIETEVVSGSQGATLRVRIRPGESVRRAGPVVVSADVVQLRAVASAGSGDVDIGALRTPAFKLSMAGSTDAVLARLDTQRLQVSIAGSGDLRVGGGHADEVKLSIAGSGDADLAAMAADHVKVSIAGSGDADVHADKSLSVSVAGSGDVRYRGAAPQVKSSIVGSGSVRSR